MKTISFNNVTVKYKKKSYNESPNQETHPSFEVLTGDHCSPQMVLQEYFGPDIDVLTFDFDEMAA